MSLCMCVLASVRACVRTSLMNHTFSVDVKHHETKKLLLFIRAQELCEHGGGPGLALIPCPILPPYLIPVSYTHLTLPTNIAV